MAVTYKKPFHLLIDKGLTNTELMEKASLVPISLPASSVTIIFLSIPLRRFVKLSNVEPIMFCSSHQIKENRTTIILGDEYREFQGIT